MGLFQGFPLRDGRSPSLEDAPATPVCACLQPRCSSASLSPVYSCSSGVIYLAGFFAQPAAAALTSGPVFGSCPAVIVESELTGERTQ
jgi:hypothetical protein